MTTGQPVLIVLGGLPGTGKTTVARQVARGLPAAYVRIDTIEAAIARAEGTRDDTDRRWTDAPGYLVGYDVAADQLRAGLSVVAESVNALGVTRDAWRRAGLAAGARVLEVELVCSDQAAHRERVEQRTSDLADLAMPTWADVVGRAYEPWRRGRTVIDTATVSADEAARRIMAEASR